MLKVFATDVVISKGYDNAPAIRYSNGEKGSMARFRFGKRTYDPQTKENSRWINMSVKAFGPICERMKKMQLKDGSFVNLIGRLDEETWTDQTSGEKKSATVIILDEIEYAYGGGKSRDDQNAQQNSSAQAPGQTAPASDPQQSDNFTGYEPFGGGSFFDMN